MIDADLIDEELGAGGMHLVAKASEPIRMHREEIERRSEPSPDETAALSSETLGR